MPWLRDLDKAVKTSGLKVRIVRGWKSRGHGPIHAVDGIVCHHTAGAATGNYPSLRVVRDGHGTLAGPLSQLGLARDGSVYVIAAGRAWHAGSGSWPGLRGNNDCIGIEAESTGRGDWTDAQLDAYPRLVRALVDHYDISWSRVIGHYEWTTRKIDPYGWPGGMDGLRATARNLTPDGDWLDMASESDVRRIVREEVERGHRSWAEKTAKRAGQWADHFVWRRQFKSPENGKTYSAWQYLLTGYQRAGSAVYQTRWRHGERGELGLRPGIESIVERMAEKVLGKVRGTYGSGSEVPVKLNSPGAHRYAWGAMQENQRTQAMLHTLADHLDSTGGLKAELTAAAARVDAEMSEDAE